MRPRSLTAQWQLRTGFWLYEKGAEEGSEAIRLEPDSPYSYAALIENLIGLNRPDDAQNVYNQAVRRKLNGSYFNYRLYLIAFLKRDAQTMQHYVVASAGHADFEDQMLTLEASTAAYFGQLDKAKELNRRAVASARGTESYETAAIFEAGQAVHEALLGDVSAAAHRSESVLALSQSIYVEDQAALALTYTQKFARAETIALDLSRQYPENTLVQFNYLPTLKARLAIAKNEALKAIEVLRVASPYETASEGYAYPIYVRGEAYLAAHRSREAAEEFQKILDHPGIVQNEVIGALAHLQLGRAYAMQGNTTQAKATYPDFLTLWKDADPDTPVLKQAKAEYGKLQ